jgi:hypothetical protein
MKIRVFAEVLGTLTILAGAVVFYHEMDLEPLETSSRNVELISLRASLTNLYVLGCKNGGLVGPMLSDLQDQLQRHYDLAGREYLPPPCKD